MPLLGTDSQPSIPRFRHIIAHIDNGWAATFTHSNPDTLSKNLLVNSVEKAAFGDDSLITQFHGSSFNHLDKKDLVLNLVKSVGDTVVLESWSCGTYPVVWIAPCSTQELEPALIVIQTLRYEFSEDALDIVLLHEGVRTPHGKFEVPRWQESWRDAGYFAHCGSPNAVFSVLRHVTQSTTDSERVVTRAQGLRRHWASKEPMRQDVVRYGGASSFHATRRKGDPVDTIRFYDRQKPW